MRNRLVNWLIFFLFKAVSPCTQLRKTRLLMLKTLAPILESSMLDIQLNTRLFSGRQSAVDNVIPQ